MNRFFRSFIVIAGFMAAHSVDAVDDDVYGEGALPRFEAPAPVSEQGLVLPPYPSGDKLLPVDIDRKGGPFSLWIDPASLTVGEDGIIRYTVVMRSRSGVENVVYEGLRCDRKQYRRYAYASEGAFRPVTGSEWKFIRKIPRDRYRTILLDEYFCPLPKSDGAQKILRKLKAKQRRIESFE